MAKAARGAKASTAMRLTGKRKRQQRLRAFVAAIIVGALALGLGLGFYFGGQTNQSAASLFDQGRQAFKEGKYADAITLYRQGLAKDPTSAEGYNLLGIAYRYRYLQDKVESLRTGEIEAFRKAVALNPNYVDALLNLGQTLLDTGAKQEAVVYLKKVLELNPDHPDRATIEQMIRQASLPQQ
jgi:cytochrome c-type biogenesis protein CcmH/NrfG